MTHAAKAKARRRGRLLAMALAAWVGLLVPAAQAQYLPRLAFKVLSTAHFRIYYHQGEEAVAMRLARMAESVRADVASALRLEAPGVTHVVLSSQDDTSNGEATPLPYRTVRLSAAWPLASDLVGNTDDWLRLVFIHEYVHIVQLERARGWARIPRALLGRSPAGFPNLFLPQWQIEGLATLWESRLTGLGRVNGGDSASIVRQLARARRQPLDRVSGGLVDWPGGDAAYLEGAWFYDYLLGRFGEEAVGRVAEATAGRFYYLSAPAFKRVFHESLGRLWKDHQRELQQRVPPLSAPAPLRLTSQGFFVSSPRFVPDGAAVVYARRDPNRFPSIDLVSTDARVTRRLADRFGGTRLSVSGDRVYFDQTELQENAAWRSDLYVVSLAGGRAQRLTHDARLVEPDVSPDGSRLACIRVLEDGRRALAVFAVERQGVDERLTPLSGPIGEDPRFVYGAPRWSPDGRRLAVERRSIDGPFEIVVFDVSGGPARVIASTQHTRTISPAWMPDGSAVLFASDRLGREFQVYAVSPEGGSPKQVTSVAGGAEAPDVSADGRTLGFISVDASGYHVCTTDLQPERWAPVAEGADAPPVPASASPAPSGGASLSAGPSSSYSPLPTLLPRAWTPLADSEDGRVRVGFGVAGADVLGRHSYSASALWRFGEVDAPGGAHRERPDWALSYVYSRWRPALFAAASEKTSFLTVSTTTARSVEVELRERSVTAGLAVPIRKARSEQVWQAAFNAGHDELGAPYTVTSDRNALRLAWAVNTGKKYGRSISAEDGVAASVTAELVRSAFGADGDGNAFTGELRAYLRPFAGHSVLAARAACGRASGDVQVRRRFYLGGSMPAGPLVNFGSDDLRMLRGFDRVSSGSRIVVGNVEWRQPLLRVERGWGTFPVFLRVVHATLFADTGNAWDDEFHSDAFRTAVGAEGSIDVVAGYSLPLTLSVGVAWTRDGASAGRRGTSVYFRFGPSF